VNLNSRIAAIERRQPPPGRCFVVWPPDGEDRVDDPWSALTDDERAAFRPGDRIIAVSYEERNEKVGIAS
jgi:hypothetical protein